MNSKVKNFDNLAHGFLLIGFMVGAVVIFGLRFDSSAQFLVVLVMAVFYLVWGLVYHHIKRDFNLKLFFEYVAIAGLSIASAVLVFLR